MASRVLTANCQGIVPAAGQSGNSYLGKLMAVWVGGRNAIIGCLPIRGAAEGRDATRESDMKLLETKVKPDVEGLRRCVLREGTPARVHFIELFQDREIKRAVADRYGLEEGLDPEDPLFLVKREVRVQEFLGYDMVRLTRWGFGFPREGLVAADTTEIPGQRREERGWMNEHSGPIRSWDDFERYPWPSPGNVDTSLLEWFEKNLPEGVGVYSLTCHIMELGMFLMGLETLCYKLYDEPDLVDALFDRVGRVFLEFNRILCQFSCVEALFGSDDMGFKTQTLLPPDVLREKVLPWHKKSAEVAHEHGKLYFIHSCGNLEAIMDDLIDDVKIDAKHSFEDAILPVTESQKRYGDRVALLGGIDMDFLCRSGEEQIRRRVRETLDQCQPGGGYCLGTGNSVANYIPLDNYLVMLDEGRRYRA